MNEMSGYIKLHRSFKNWEWYKDLPTKTIYLHLLLSANYKPDTWRGIKLNAGQLVTSRSALCAATALSEQQVRTAIKHLKDTGYITVEATNCHSIITVNYWEMYQSDCVTSTYKVTNQNADDSPAETPHLKNNKKQRTEEVVNKESVVNRPLSKRTDYPFCNEDGSVDYDKLRCYIKTGTC